MLLGADGVFVHVDRSNPFGPQQLDVSFGRLHGVPGQLFAAAHVGAGVLFPRRQRQPQLAVAGPASRRPQGDLDLEGVAVAFLALAPVRGRDGQLPGGGILPPLRPGVPQFGVHLIIELEVQIARAETAGQANRGLNEAVVAVAPIVVHVGQRHPTAFFVHPVVIQVQLHPPFLQWGQGGFASGLLVFGYPARQHFVGGRCGGAHVGLEKADGLLEMGHHHFPFVLVHRRAGPFHDFPEHLRVHRMAEFVHAFHAGHQPVLFHPGLKGLLDPGPVGRIQMVEQPAHPEGVFGEIPDVLLQSPSLGRGRHFPKKFRKHPGQLLGAGQALTYPPPDHRIGQPDATVQRLEGIGRGLLLGIDPDPGGQGLQHVRGGHQRADFPQISGADAHPHQLVGAGTQPGIHGVEAGLGLRQILFQGSGFGQQVGRLAQQALGPLDGLGQPVDAGDRSGRGEPVGQLLSRSDDVVAQSFQRLGIGHAQPHDPFLQPRVVWRGRRGKLGNRSLARLRRRFFLARAAPMTGFGFSAFPFLFFPNRGRRFAGFELDAVGPFGHVAAGIILGPGLLHHLGQELVVKPGADLLHGVQHRVGPDFRAVFRQGNQNGGDRLEFAADAGGVHPSAHGGVDRRPDRFGNRKVGHQLQQPKEADVALGDVPGEGVESRHAEQVEQFVKFGFAQVGIDHPVEDALLAGRHVGLILFQPEQPPYVAHLVEIVLGDAGVGGFRAGPPGRAQFGARRGQFLGQLDVGLAGGRGSGGRGGPPGDHGLGCRGREKLIDGIENFLGILVLIDQREFGLVHLGNDVRQSAIGRLHPKHDERVFPVVIFAGFAEKPIPAEAHRRPPFSKGNGQDGQRLAAAGDVLENGFPPVLEVRINFPDVPAEVVQHSNVMAIHERSRLVLRKKSLLLVNRTLYQSGARLTNDKCKAFRCLWSCVPAIFGDSGRFSAPVGGAMVRFDPGGGSPTRSRSARFSRLVDRGEEEGYRKKTLSRVGVEPPFENLPLAATWKFGRPERRPRRPGGLPRIMSDDRRRIFP